MPGGDDFVAAILEDEVVLRHIDDGHVFHFPIASNGTVCVQGCRIEPNPNGRREAHSYMPDAHSAALMAFSRGQS
jgi:hypothetical protein